MLAIIPARGGSKGLPGKNIKKLAGKALIGYTIEAALNANEITQVLVSTEDDEIAAIAKSYGAEIPFMRPAELATDTALSIDTYLFTLDKLKRDYDKQHNQFVVLQPTSPLRTSNDIDNAIKLFKANNADSVISFCEESHSIFWHKYLEKNGKIKSIFPEEVIGNRQDLKKTYYPNGAIYVFKTDLIKNRAYYTEKSYAYIMHKNNSIDIDYIEDFEYAEYAINKRRKV